MSDFGRPRGLGRGLSALLGEPRPVTPPMHDTPVRAAPIQPAPSVQAPPVMAPPQITQPQAANVVELPKINPAPQPPAPQAASPFGEAPPAPKPAPQPQQMAQAAASGDAARNLPIDLIQRNPNQPRRHFDEAELSELADSIKAHGVLQPILVRPIAEGRFEIVAGERRWRAAQRASLHTIPAVIRELDEAEVLEIGIIENVQRSDLNPIEEALGFQALIDRFQRTQQDIADVVGKSRPHIANMLRLLALPDELQEMVRDGRLSAGHARAILTAPNPRELAQRAIAEGLSVREIERLASAAKDERHGPRASHPSAPPIEKDADTCALEKRLSDALGLAVTIADKNGQGDVKISYRTLEQLDDIARRLSGSSF
ncbi:MAG: ParB/RepB/Spo0J family partition protein [Caulobacterales bacterium]